MAAAQAVCAGKPAKRRAGGGGGRRCGETNGDRQQVVCGSGVAVVCASRRGACSRWWYCVKGTERAVRERTVETEQESRKQWSSAGTGGTRTSPVVVREPEKAVAAGGGEMCSRIRQSRAGNWCSSTAVTKVPVET